MCFSYVTGMLLERATPNIGVDVEETYEVGILTHDTSIIPLHTSCIEVTNENGRKYGHRSFLLLL